MSRSSSVSLASLLLALTATACTTEDVASRTSPVVYDDDDRIEVYEDPSAARRARARESIVALIPKGNLIGSINGYAIDPEAGTLDAFIEGGTGMPLCDDQRFRDQPAAGNCSGTLIDDDLVLTAGHCVDSLGACQGYYFTFDYFYESEDVLATIDPDDVYECEEVVAFRLDDTPPFLDLAIVRLTRPVEGDRSPAPVDTSDDALPPGTDVTVMGFGSGIPLKIDAGGEVLSSNASLSSFLATTDTFGGNSGSGVFDDAGNVVGILVAGQQDYIERAGQSCIEVNVLDPDEDSPVGETITYVNRAIEELCESDYPSERLCGITPTCGDGFCTGDETEATCEEDCTPPVCGDGVCDRGESCARDCDDDEGGGKKGRCSVSAPGSDRTGRVLAILTLSGLGLTLLRRRARRG